MARAKGRREKLGGGGAVLNQIKRGLTFGLFFYFFMSFQKVGGGGGRKRHLHGIIPLNLCIRDYYILVP